MVASIYCPTNTITPAKRKEVRNLWYWVQQIVQAAPKRCDIVILTVTNGHVGEKNYTKDEQIGGLEDVFDEQRGISNRGEYR